MEVSSGAREMGGGRLCSFTQSRRSWMPSLDGLREGKPGFVADRERSHPEPEGDPE